MKKPKVVVIIILALVVGFLLGQSYQQPIQISNVSNSTEQVEQLSITINFGNATQLVDTLDWQEDLSLHEATRITSEKNNLDFAFKDYGELGLLVERIGNDTNGDNNSYWQYWVNNEQLQVSASNYIVAPGDSIEWQFKESVY